MPPSHWWGRLVSECVCARVRARIWLVCRCRLLPEVSAHHAEEGGGKGPVAVLVLAPAPCWAPACGHVIRALLPPSMAPAVDIWALLDGATVDTGHKSC